ncbi:MAG: hypothetical protein ABIT38_20010 [Gemmatimonadaceae bacterium]
MRSRLVTNLLFAAVAIVLVTPSLRAQALSAPVGEAAVSGAAVASATTNTLPARAESIGPRRDAGVAGIRAEPAANAKLPAPAQARRNNTSTAATLTILGGAAFVGGLLINNNAGNAIAVVGLGTALIGLYMWLR